MANQPRTKTAKNKKGKKNGVSGSSFFTWFMVIALLGVWTSVAVVWFDLVDYEEVLGKLGIYDADGDGDFDVDDAKVLLGQDPGGIAKAKSKAEGLKERPEAAQATLEEEPSRPDETSPFDIDDIGDLEDVEERIQASHIHEALRSKSDENEDDDLEETPPVEDEGNMETEFLLEDFFDDEKEELSEDGQFEEDVQLDEGVPVEPLSSHDLHGEPKQDLEGPEEEEPTDAGATYEAETEDAAHGHEEEVEEAEPELSEIYETYDYKEDEQLDLESLLGKEPDVELEANLDTEPEMELELEDMQESEPDDEQEPGQESEMEHELKSEPESEFESDPVTKPEHESELEPELEFESEQELELEYELDDEPESEKEPQYKEEPEPEQTMEPEQEPELRMQDTEYHEDSTTPDTIGTTEQENEYIPDKHPDEKEEKAVPVEGQKEHLSGETDKAPMGKQEKEKKKKPKVLNKFDKSIKAELDAAEKLRKKGKTDEAAKAFEELVKKYPQSPRARYGKAQCEDDLAEKRRSNEMLQNAVSTYEEAANLPNAPLDLVKLALKRRANRQQFLGRTRSSLVTLQRLVQLFPDDISLRNDLGVGYLLIGDNSNAKKVYEEVLSLAPNDGFAKVHYGFILKAQNQIEESIPYLKEGLESGDPGTDDGRFYFHLGDAMQRVGNPEAYTWYEIGHQRGHFASVWQRSLYNVNGLKAQPWWTARETGYTELIKSLEKNWKVIRDEGLAVMDKAKGLFIPEDENLREKGDWSQYTLWQQGRKNENACKSAPKTCALLERFPESTGCRRGQIKYSVMHPGTHVWPHTGPTNCRLRMHLGLVIPNEGCRIRCANDTRSWDEGKVLIFDDSFEHEVWQDARDYRLIFIVDVWHPELTAQQRRTLPAI
ncbi:aspartyl/asparaginyl beta-hydroxylase isoform X4 [Ambystoma mexicanum]|uniref:aspartyl/asparaginyl beta-hydroxylase isoform X4 n=1 Tax=Ambystoma mexicanum TaxID=8296 RepID=UPI0037E900F0